ncbi:MAG: hypothetical protein M3P49_15125, partial [Actinomycetota bacterium]|nr:hypothetical protein [Actinomycetota bacterium]
LLDEDRKAGAGASRAEADEEARISYAEEEEGGLFELVYENWYYVVGAAAVVVVALVLIGKLLGGAGAPESSAPNAGATAGTSLADAGVAERSASDDAAQAAMEAVDTGVVIEEPTVKDGSYYLKVGELAWKGRVTETETGQELRLEGPYVANFKDAVTLPHGSITTGVFGRAEPGQPMVHATYQRTTIGEQEEAQGTYEAIDGGDVILKGYYDDTREGDAITRVYSEREPGETEWSRYAVRFEAPVGAPIPALVGWEPPAPVDDPEGAG